MALVPEVKEEWLSRLRSGDYHQGKDNLRSDGEDKTYHCCLGVLCEIFIDQSDQAKFIQADEGVCKSSYGRVCSMVGCETEISSMMPPMEVKEWARISRTECNRLSTLNDTGSSFEMIADIIEKDL